ncbi:MAG: methyltransferase domain-containing protein [Acidobacteria bacterium]|nr:methyltransferase domain-containing protein [Acidobacteriota bacterium]MCI0663094.1 methyltransferase domain-containing protein [Acidobacteriota bacterium]
MSRIKNITRNLRFIFSRELADIEERLNKRANDYEKAIDARIDERSTAIDGRLSNYESALDTRLDERFDERTETIDGRLDERLTRIERLIDERFNLLEQRSDERMERHERKIDAMVRQMTNDIVDRNDVMLQIFEERLDKQRRELRSIQEAGMPESMRENSAEESTGKGDDEAENYAKNGSPPQQLISFRKLADVSAHVKTKVKTSGDVALYHQILAWKKVAHEGLNNFTPDEQEMVNYILSFLDDPQEAHYVNQHLRRFVSTLQRIPPAESSTDRLLELGSLSHLAPAVRKYCGYQEVRCADFWDSDEQLTHHIVRQKNGTDTYTFELRNFNVERDPFPYPDGYFRVVLCCELIEHLQSDPMHMLWECNRVLEENGYLLLTTPNIASARAIEGLLVGCAPYLLAQYNIKEVVDQHNREYAPYEVGIALAAAGFKVVELETEDVWMRSNPAILDLLKQVQISTELRGDNIFALARKSGSPIERYPKELYID